MSQLIRWLEEEFLAASLEEVGGTKSIRTNIEKLARSFAKNGTIVSSAFSIINAFIVIKYGFPMSPTGYAAVVFKADGVIYAYAYWARPKSRGEPGSVPTPEYVCVSPTFDSRDGEYRKNFLVWADYETAYEKLMDELSTLEDHLLEMVEEGLELKAEAFGGDGPAAKEALAAADELRLPVRFLASLWYFHRDPLLIPWENHTTIEFLQLLEKLLARAGRLSYPTPEPFRFRTGRPNALRPSCGQKIIPLTVLEVADEPDVNFAPWREIFASQITNELLINFVAPSFPIFSQWTFIEGTDASFYANPGMQERFRRSEKARAILKLLREARRQTGASPEGGAPDGFVLGQVDSKTYELIQYVMGFAVLSDISLCMVMQNVGSTLQTFFEVVMGRGPVFHELNLFELLYSAMALHRAGIVHGDLHLNNITMQESRQVSSDGHSVVFQVCGSRASRDARDTYTWPLVPWLARIIDFSRATLGGPALERLRKEKGEQYARNFQRDQAIRVLRTFQRYAPQFTERNVDLINAAILARPAEVFELLGLVDLLAIGRNVARGLGAELDRDPATRTSKENPSGTLEGEIREQLEHIKKQAERVERAALESLMEGLREVTVSAGSEARNGATSRDAMSVSPRETHILRSVFGEQLMRAERSERSKLSERIPLEVYVLDRPLKYSGRDYSLFPPWAKYEEISEHLAGRKFSDVVDRGVEPLFESIAAPPPDLLREQVRAREGEDEAPDVTSSWIVA